MSKFNAAKIIRAAIPGADDSTIDHVIWGRTPYPFAPVTPKSLYKAASALRRAGANGITLCDWCHRIAEPDNYTCAGCTRALARTE